MYTIPSYKTELIEHKRIVQFLFESSGERSIVKAIEYTPFKKKDGRWIYNLGFGDYEEVSGKILDRTNSNNGDMRRVFSTVLDTIPTFFKLREDAAVWIQGSDSTDEFTKNCMENCSKNCLSMCKNFNRRIRVYRYYIDKHFEWFSKNYILFGYTDDEKPDLVQYIPNNEYIGILVFKKK